MDTKKLLGATIAYFIILIVATAVAAWIVFGPWPKLVNACALIFVAVSVGIIVFYYHTMGDG